MQLSPSQPIPVSYSVLPTDATLYYVQSVLRDTTSNQVLQTINLTQDPNALYRYTGAFGAVSDPSGLGRPIDITTIVYTDSGHTVLSQNYAAAQFNYVVLQPWIPTLGSGGGGSIDYRKLRIEIAALIDEKLYGTEENKKDSFMARTKEELDYSRIEAAISANSEGLGERLLEAHGNDSRYLASVIVEGMQNLAESGDKSHTRVEDVHQLLNSLMRESRQGHSDTRAQVLKEIKDNHRTSNETVRGFISKLGRDFLDYSKSSMESLKTHLNDSVSDKEIKYVLNMESPQKKSPIEGPKGYSMEDVNKILS